MCVLSTGHQSAVVSVWPLVSVSDWGRQALLGTDSADRGLSFQLATLEHNAVIYVWVSADITLFKI